MRAFLVACCIIVALLLPTRVRAFWGPVGSGMDSAVYAITTFDGLLIAGGAFLEAGGNPANSIAMWNGAAWNPLGIGVGGVSEPRVFALIEFNGSLIAGGRFMEAGGGAASNIARWDGTSWSPLGLGVEGTVYALAIYQGRLIAGGDFLYAGGTRVNCIAQWDGSSWSGLGSGFDCVNCGNDFAVLSLGVHRGTALIAGGWFNYAGGFRANYIASWTGLWTPLGPGMDYPVSAIIDYNGDLIAGGAFSHAGGHEATGIARWDGTSWSPLGEGVVGWYNWVRALAVYDGALIAGGFFDEAGGKPANHIAQWNGGSWNALEEGTDGSVASLAVSDNLLIVGGSFELAGGGNARKIARWDDRARGACCLHAFCQWCSEPECVGYGGTYEGNGTLCEPNPCPTSAVDGESPGGTSLDLQAVPNPSTGEVLILYQLPVATGVTVGIFDASGHLVRWLPEGRRLAGPHSMAWDGRDDRGRELPSGVYLVRLTTAEATTTGRTVIAR